MADGAEDMAGAAAAAPSFDLSMKKKKKKKTLVLDDEEKADGGAGAAEAAEVEKMDGGDDKAATPEPAAAATEAVADLSRKECRSMRKESCMRVHVSLSGMGMLWPLANPVSPVLLRARRGLASMDH